MKNFSDFIKKFKFSDPTIIYDIEYWIYVFTGCWDFKSDTEWQNVAYKMYRVLSVCIYIIAITFFTLDAYNVSNDLQKLSFNMSSTFLLYMTIGKVSLFLKEKDNLEDLLERLENNFYIKAIGVSPEDKNIFKKKAELLYVITIVFYVFLVMGLPMRVFADITVTRTYLIPLPIPGTEPYFELFYTPQIGVIFHFLVTVLAHDLLLYTIIMRFNGHFEILEKNIKKIRTLYPRRYYEKYVRGFVENTQEMNFVNDVLIRTTNNSENVQKFLESYSLDKVDWAEGSEAREKKTFELLKENINHHQKLLEDIKVFNRIYSTPLLIQACGAGISFGIVILQVFFLSGEVNALLVGQVMYMLTMLCNVLCFCSFATDLKTKSHAVADALYDTPWYDMSSKNRQVVQITIKKLIEGPRLKGGGQIVVDRETYLKFLRISYNFIAILRQVY